MIRVEVNGRNIRKGIAGDCRACPVALSLNDATGRSCEVALTEWFWYIGVGGLFMKAPDEVIEFVLGFDRLEKVESLAELPDELRPFAFEIPDLDSPEWSVRPVRPVEVYGGER